MAAEASAQTQSAALVVETPAVPMNFLEKLDGSPTPHAAGLTEAFDEDGVKTGHTNGVAISFANDHGYDREVLANRAASQARELVPMPEQMPPWGRDLRMVVTVTIERVKQEE